MSENQTQNQTLTRAGEIAREIALKSYEDAVFVIDDGVMKLEKGRYGGWLLRGVGPESGRGVWCYAVNEQEAPADVAEKLAWMRERMMKVANSLGVKDEPKAFTRTLKFRLVDVSQKKATERYTVYDITPTGEEVEAVVAVLRFEVRMSRRGKCYNDACRVRDRLAMLLKAEFKGEEAATDGVTVTVPYDTSKLEEAVAKLMEEGAGEEADEAVEESGNDTAGGAGDEGVKGRAKDFIGYLVLVKFPRNVDGDAVMAMLEEAIKQKLKELNVTASVKVAKADL